MSLLWLAVLSSLLPRSDSGKSVVRATRSSDVFLRRQKRYLSFPTGSNLVLTLSLVKPVMQVQPQGWNVIGECDVPFPLPNDTRANRFKPHQRQTRELYSVAAQSLERNGLNGTACLGRLFCDAREYVRGKEGSSSLVRDLLFSLFRDAENEGFNEQCDAGVFVNCAFPLFAYIMKSLGYSD